jgi:hypothetical protein
MSEKVTLYRIDWLDIIGIMLTKGLWLLWVIWSNGVEIELPETDA